MNHTSDTTARLRATLGPALIGSLGGLGVGLAGMAVLTSICRNARASYSQFPSLAPPPLPFLDLPLWAGAIVIALGCGLLFVTGIPVARLARGRDAVDDLTAGVTAGLAAALTALGTGGGAVLVIACVIVPSISDLALLSGAHAPFGAEAPKMVDRYPDLGAVAAEERGAVLMAKIISDQISGSARAGWIVGAFALLGVGAPVLAGTLAGGHLRRRGCSRRAAALTYLELTLVSAVTAELVGLVVLNPTGAQLAGGLGALFAALALIGLITVAVLSAFAAVKQRPVPLRVGLILAWGTIIPLAVSGTFWWPGAAVAAAVLVVAGFRTSPPRAASSGQVELSAGA